ncbi:MAG: acyl-CoA-binding protein [Flavobacteriaceae bacterium]|nr:acyl-CoA-binding protein [Flavobacteriaceae bacterium]
MEDLDKNFDKAFQIASMMTEELPADIMLRFYAFYKIATNDRLQMPSGNSELRNGFKLNALLQFKDVSPIEAKKEYIALVEKYTNQKI